VKKHVPLRKTRCRAGKDEGGEAAGARGEKRSSGYVIGGSSVHDWKFASKAYGGLPSDGGSWNSEVVR
jgi:hypothetical protein